MLKFVRKPENTDNNITNCNNIVRSPSLHYISVKNFILIGDLQQSIFFLRWKEENRSLNLLAQDFGEMEVASSEFIIDGSTLAMLVADNLKNVQIFSYAPQSSESWQGKKLLSKSEFYTGCTISKFVRVKVCECTVSNQLRVSELKMRADLVWQVMQGAFTACGSLKDVKEVNRYAGFFSSYEGSMGYIMPLEEQVSRLLMELTTLMTKRKEINTYGLNPRVRIKSWWTL